MKRQLLFALLCCSLTAGAADKTYVRAKLVDVVAGHVASGGGGSVYGGTGNISPTIERRVFHVSVQIDDIVYTGETHAKEVSKLVVGDQVDVRLKGDSFYLKPDGKWEIRLRILSRKRTTN